MKWQDLAIVLAQAVCAISLWPTVRDRRKWPPRLTTLPTGAALALMATAMLSLGLHLSAALVYCLAGLWLLMGRGTP